MPPGFFVSSAAHVQEGDTLWFAGGLQGVAFLLKMPGLRHIDEEHTKKTNVDILERRLVQVLGDVVWVWLQV